MTPLRRPLVLLASTAVIASAVAFPSAAQAKSPRVIETASCGSIATKLKLSAEDHGLQVEYELDQNRNDQRWRLRLVHNGTVAATATRTTRAPSGSFGWRVVTADGSGTDTVTVVARRGSTTCRITARL
ncbi:MAG: hypothetical protein R2737_14610 [Candidatus Nanopelagicales bacterium]